jgi:adenosyl cobinamide kinase/adenosyl cobinamide phosphate guanylyltransferase
VLTLLLGGARSGKSRFAVDLGRRHEATGGSVVFVATAPRQEGADWDERIERHRAERPGWPTIEAPSDITGALTGAASEAFVIVDCLTLWVSNLMLHGNGPDIIVDAAAEFAEVAADREGPTVVVSNEVGLGVHPETELGRNFRDILGSVNQRVAAGADQTLFFVAGRALSLSSPWELVP